MHYIDIHTFIISMLNFFCVEENIVCQHPHSHSSKFPDVDFVSFSFYISMESNLIGILDTFSRIMFYDRTELGDLPYPCSWILAG